MSSTTGDINIPAFPVFSASKHAQERKAVEPRFVKPLVTLFPKYTPHPVPIARSEIAINSRIDVVSVVTEIVDSVQLIPDVEYDTAVAAVVDVLTLDFYVNGASDKRSFQGAVTSRGCVIPLPIVGDIIRKRTNGVYRLFVRAFADTMIEVLTHNEAHRPYIDKRAKEYNIDAYDAKFMFDGADGADNCPRIIYKRLSALKKLKLLGADSSTARKEADFEDVSLDASTD